LNLKANQKLVILGGKLDEVKSGTSELLELSQAEFDKLSVNGSLVLSISESSSESLKNLHSKTDTAAKETHHLLGKIDAKLTKLLEKGMGENSEATLTASSDELQDIKTPSVQISSITLHASEPTCTMEKTGNCQSLNEQLSWESHGHLSMPLHRIARNLGDFAANLFSPVIGEYISSICAWRLLRAHERLLLTPIELAPENTKHFLPTNIKFEVGRRISHLRKMCELDNEMSTLEEVDRMLEVDEDFLQRCADVKDNMEHGKGAKTKSEIASQLHGQMRTSTIVGINQWLLLNLQFMPEDKIRHRDLLLKEFSATRANEIRIQKPETEEQEVQELSKKYAQKILYSLGEKEWARLVLKHWGLEETWVEGDAPSTVGPISEQTDRTIKQNDVLVDQGETDEVDFKLGIDLPFISVA
jgi:hypothetical protein